ncbi:prolipoprotein diacylglyceryl transferase [Jeotgalibaca porci]|uniref:Phosphatidylglycerol--prolipoprotein diacylglyceryl transferase n=1 Tax=Jeotgalibaca porci TaxID=1868793 RepID=A0A6G7WGU7_9LACT|nr:prolipoprotein diacylglyceryl transferase [Jeotgalibaca porci]NLB98024.1 prolipoprotein diacylglyceryl transferase [Lactobacillales bacterium]QIK51439.1 prolipoprotein diacylglyceryl transferase [Jeotgalibaca porci]
MKQLLAAIDPIAIKLGGFEVAWYGVIIGVGILLAMYLASSEGDRKGMPQDFILDLAFWTVPIAILGARAYYVLFELGYYLENPGQIFQIWNGGLAIYGALLTGALVVYFFTKKKNVPVMLTLDVLAPGVLIAQSLGRWGNFINQEAHGAAVTREFLEGLFLPEFIINQMNIKGTYYHPTFLYESLWSLIGFALIVYLRRRPNLLREGEVFFSYIIWYAFGRFFIEGMRTDSLYLFANIRVSQLLSIILIAGAIAAWAYRRYNHYPKDSFYTDINLGMNTTKE